MAATRGPNRAAAWGMTMVLMERGQQSRITRFVVCVFTMGYWREAAGLNRIGHRVLRSSGHGLDGTRLGCAMF